MYNGDEMQAAKEGLGLEEKATANSGEHKAFFPPCLAEELEVSYLWG